MNSLPLPVPIEAYFASEHRPEHMASCFTADAVMVDDGHTYSGVTAITTFLEAAAARYHATRARR